MQKGEKEGGPGILAEELGLLVVGKGGCWHTGNRGLPQPALCFTKTLRVAIVDGCHQRQ